jgi:aminotransferase
MENKVSQRVKNIEISGIRKFYNKVAKVDGAISLTIGQPDFPVPDKIKKAMIDAINENKTGYTSNAGILELRQEISDNLKKDNIHFDADEICITVGGSEGIMSVFSAVLNPMDKVLIPTPAYPAYENCVRIAGGEVVNYELISSDFSIHIENLKRLIKDCKPKAIVLSFPCNPTGAVLNKASRDELYNILKDEDIIIITDEMYSALTYSDEYYSMAQCKDLKKKVILINGFSKIFSMTGLRIGYVCASENFMNQIMKVHQYSVSCAPSIVQYGALEGLKSCTQDVEKMRLEFKKRRDFLYEGLTKLGFEVSLPQGAFYMFPAIGKYNMDSEVFCEKLLQNAKVAVVPGSAFGKGGEGYFRVSYASSIRDLDEALRRIKREVIKW